MDKKYSGATVNERLFLSGLITEFDNAVAQKDYYKAKELLRKVELSEESIVAVLANLGISNPIQDIDKS